MLNPLVRATWAPKGQTPMLPIRARHREKVNVIGALTVSPHAKRPGFYFATDPHAAFNAHGVCGFLDDLLRHLRGRVIVIWDGASTHHGKVMQAYLRAHPRLWLHRLPPYSPHLNPIEAVWGWLKYGRLANFVPDSTAEIEDAMLEHLIELRHRSKLLKALWARSGIPFPERVLHNVT